MMLENFIYAKLKSLFEKALNNGEVLDEAIVFIEDTKEIWNHGTYFDGSKVDLSNMETKTNAAATYQPIGDYALTSDITEIKTQLGDINTILEFIINGNPDTPDNSIKKMITFTVKSEMYPNLSTYTYEAEEGMTWEEFLNNSEYPIYPLHPQSFDSGTYVNCNGYDGNYVIYSSAKVAQLISYTIIDGEVYTYHDEK